MDRKDTTGGDDIQSVPSKDGHSIEDRGEYDNDSLSWWDDADEEGAYATHKDRESCTTEEQDVENKRWRHCS